jgi:DNA-directed RNA polymerase subunit beta
MGDFPIMTETGTFVINGAERVIVSQIIRSPGMYYATEVDKNGKDVYSVQVIPYRGAWLEYEFDANDAIFVRIDKTRKLPLTVFIRALMFMSMNGKDTKDDIYELFGEEPLLNETFVRDETEGLSAHSGLPFGVEALKEIYKKLRPGEPATQEAAQNQLHNYFFDPKRYDIATVGRTNSTRRWLFIPV